MFVIAWHVGNSMIRGPLERSNRCARLLCRTHTHMVLGSRSGRWVGWVHRMLPDPPRKRSAQCLKGLGEDGVCKCKPGSNIWDGRIYCWIQDCSWTLLSPNWRGFMIPVNPKLGRWLSSCELLGYEPNRCHETLKYRPLNISREVELLSWIQTTCTWDTWKWVM